jgi:hypothetical protein
MKKALGTDINPKTNSARNVWSMLEVIHDQYRLLSVVQK